MTEINHRSIKVGGEDDSRETTIVEPKAATIAEDKMGVRQALLSYRWAVIWSLTISMAIIMEGYDTFLIGSFYAYPAFQRHFGKYYGPRKGYQVPQAWQSAVGAGGNVGSIIGSFLNGYLVERFGFRKVFMGTLVCMSAFIFISFFGTTIETQVAGQILCGIPWGIFATLGPAYSSELLPMTLRPYLTAYVNMCFVIGQFIGGGLLQSLVSRNDQWSYRIPFAVQWAWPAPLFLAAWFMPESPWWQVRHGQSEAAERTIQRLLFRPDKDRARQTIAMIIHTDQVESAIKAGTSYWDCFKGPDRRRTEIACITFAGQVTCGLPFAFTATYFFEQAGMNPSNAYKLGLGGNAIAFTGTFLSWFVMKRLGRRTMYLGGMALLSLNLLIIGFLTLGNQQNNAFAWAQATLCLLWLLTFSLTIGPMGWSIPPEVSSTRLRCKTICLARNTYYVASVASSIIEPYMMNPAAWNWKGRTAFLWLGFALVTSIWGYFRLPETKDRTFEELDTMFAARVPTRQFRRYQVHPATSLDDINPAMESGRGEKDAAVVTIEV